MDYGNVAWSINSAAQLRIHLRTQGAAISNTITFVIYGVPMQLTDETVLSRRIAGRHGNLLIGREKRERIVPQPRRAADASRATNASKGGCNLAYC